MPNWWLVIGRPGNWQTSFESGNLWGLKEVQRGLWQHMQKGDHLLLYASSPVRGIIGLGTLQNKFIQDRPLWKEEIERGQVLWPLIIEIDVRYCFPQDSWKERAFTTEVLKRRVKGRQTIQMIEEELAAQLVQAFPLELRPALVAAPQAPSPVEEVTSDTHADTINRLLEIGRLQKFIVEKEYDMEGNRLDVVWRRVARSVPTYVFEVHVGGNIHSALAKLKHAYDIWNSNIFLVSPSDQKALADRLLSGMFHEIQGRVKFIDIKQVGQLLDSKKKFFDLEAELGIL